MALKDVRALFRSSMESIGYEEWPDSFDFSNIPQSALDDRFHIEDGSISFAAQHQAFEVNYPLTIRVFKKGGLSPTQAVDDGLDIADSVLAVVLAPANRFGAGIKGVVINSVLPEPYSASDDNDVIIKLEFTAKLICSF